MSTAFDVDKFLEDPSAVSVTDLKGLITASLSKVAEKLGLEVPRSDRKDVLVRKIAAELGLGEEPRTESTGVLQSEAIELAKIAAEQRKLDRELEQRKLERELEFEQRKLEREGS